VKQLVGRLAVAMTVLTILSGSARAQTPGPNYNDGKGVRPVTTDERLAALEQQIDVLKQLVANMTDAPAGGKLDAGAEEKIAALEQELKVLARKAEIEKEDAAAAAKAAPGIRSGKDGFGLKSADGSFQIKFRGYVHSDTRTYPNDEVKAADQFLLRRVRPIIEGSVYKLFDFRVMPDFGEGKTVLQDAYITARFHPLLQIRAGKFKAPLGLERMASATEILFVERGLPTGLVPNRDIGVTVNGDIQGGAWTYSAGVFNGVTDGGSTDGDDQDGKDFVARVFATPFKASKNQALQGLGFGVAGSYGIQRGTAAAPNVASYKSNGQLTFFKYRADTTDAGTAIADGAHYRYSGQGYYFAGRAGVMVEQAFSSQRLRRGTTVTDAGNNALQISGSYVLTGEKASYKGVTAAHPFDRAAGSWGAFELVARYNAMTVDKGVFPFFANPANAAQSAKAWGTGVNWYLNPSIKIVADYERTTFVGGAAGGNRPVEHDFLTRFQISF
jgi:phosphate-selective porin OprO/OprP